MHDQVFADGLGQISVIGATVRLDFVTYSPTEKDPNGRPIAVFRQQIIMTMEGFTQAAEKMREATNAISNHVASLRPREVPAAAEPVVPPTTTPEPVAAVAPKPLVKAPFP